MCLVQMGTADMAVVLGSCQCTSFKSRGGSLARIHSYRLKTDGWSNAWFAIAQIGIAVMGSGIIGSLTCTLQVLQPPPYILFRTYCTHPTCTAVHTTH